MAGGHGKGSDAHQLNSPSYVFVDEQKSVYVADNRNSRVMKWAKGATEGIHIVPRQLPGSNSSSWFKIQAMLVDRSGHVYITNRMQHNVTRWLSSTSEDEVIVGREALGSAADHLSFPDGLAFDEQGNLYVVDTLNHRVQKFAVDRS